MFKSGIYKISNYGRVKSLERFSSRIKNNKFGLFKQNLKLLSLVLVKIGGKDTYFAVSLYKEKKINQKKNGFID